MELVIKDYRYIITNKWLPINEYMKIGIWVVVLDKH